MLKSDNPTRAAGREFAFTSRAGVARSSRPRGNAAVLANIPPERLADILDIAEDGVITVDARHEIVLFNRGAAKLFGYEPDEVAGRTLDLLLPGRFRGAHRDQVAGFGRSTEVARTMGHRREVYGLRKDGTEFPAEVSISKFVVGGDLLFTAIVRNVAERKRYEAVERELTRLRAEAALKSSEDRLRLALDAGGMGTWDWDLESDRVRWDGALAALVGLPEIPHPLTTETFFERVHPDDRTALRGQLAAAVAPGGQFEAEFRIVRPDGEVRWLAGRGQVSGGSDGQPRAMHGVNYEVTGRRQAEDNLKETTRQLWQAARLAGVGELAASIAHELNNPLGTVSLRVERLLSKTPADDPRRKPLEVVGQEVERMAGLVSNLLQFSRAGRDQVSTVDVPEEIAKTLELVGHHLRKRQVRVEPEIALGVPHIQADRQQLRQVFLNLFTNAADAMTAGGRLAPRVRTGLLPTGRPAVVVEVSDTGVGIPPDLLPRVCEPFFTTKEEGKGTGLGLAICRRIVQQHQGTLQVESQPGAGTTVRITLPVRPDTNVAGLGPKPSVALPNTGGSGD
ncbi:PAS domain-containing sensor histidine kinase [Limnoglobus roseus]|uniref:histidine kinase n=1 Tax=Limnoglobus roseus TaxID=2598579 RepID=A0A5C1ANK9_9BACT|nr:ATP-binding protein [Limnoglobus roseus]QEL20580.1 PAS domain S-box protein [Limnoglobus roseus]